ncbi:ABC transporter permease [Streptacidiphilus sp. P02-A3a]|uniref:ABC transporter permease n=1 Tax=Streptacidiphilus sp. P02-A3a TaxID=2704468 RepID=UPI0015F7EEEB|nr:ABC transporter permease [Streptacidiphilus sp. P02-A3a]QMU73248.1 ABC transporter permease [Streptacidiphilus sp. P02-A3a]
MTTTARNAAQTTPARTAPVPTASAWGRQLPASVRAQVLILLRSPSLIVAAIALPVVLFLVLGTSGGHQPQHGAPYAAYMLCSMGAYAGGAIMLFNFGTTLAMERGQGVDRLFRASPMRPWTYLAAKGVVAVAVAVLSFAVLAASAALLTDAGLSAPKLLELVGRLLLGSVTFLAMGMALGYVVGPTSASPIATLSYLLLSMASGLFMPLSQLPSGVRQVARYLPTYHYAQLAWGTVGAADEPWTTAAAWLGGYALVFFALAVRLYRRNQVRRFS